MQSQNIKEARFVWHPDWVSNFDSPWSVNLKFTYANQVRTEQFLQLSTSYNCSNMPVNGQSLNWGEIDTALGTCLDSTWNKFVERFVSPFTDLISQEKLLRPNMHFCPQCLKYGLHTLYHQSILLEKCPIHSARLIPGCPECHRLIPFSKWTNDFRPKYACKCGYSFLGLKSHSFCPHIWQQGNELKLTDPGVLKWVTLAPEALEYFKQRVWIHPQKLLANGTSGLGVLADFLDRRYRVGPKEECFDDARARASSMWVQHEYRPDKNKVQIEPLSSGASQELTNELGQVFKSVARYIRRHILGKHCPCIKTIVRGKPRASTCHLAMAYILTRQFVEGHQSPRDVDNGTPSSGRKLKWPFYSAIDHKALVGLKERHLGPDLKFNRFNEMKTVIAYLVLDHFNVILRELRESETETCEVNELGQTGIDMVIMLDTTTTLFVKNFLGKGIQ